MPSRSSAHLRELAPVNSLPRLRRVEIMAAAIGIEARRKPLRREHLQKPTKRRNRAFFLDQKRRVDRAGGIVHRDDQIKLRRPAEPRKPAAILMQHHPFARLAWPFATVRPAPGRT